jgi:DNA-directed RNA polymerase subunit RPC12/RpoP
MEPEKQEPIIVYKSFENSMDANLAKAKLDAFGIPCFLTDENLANLYPIQNPRFSVRLHIFEKDYNQAHEVLTETVPLADDELTRCPRCRSARVEMTYTQKLSARLLSILATLFFAVVPLRKVYRCQDCDHEF